MQKFQKILRRWPKYYFRSQDLYPLWEGSNNALRSLLKRLAQQGFLIRLKKDLYIISERLQKTPPDAMEIATLLYGPSYISFESALSYYGWIPEAVPVLCCATSKRTKKINTSLGSFIFYHIPIDIFHVGITDKKINDTAILIADPWKALADYIYIKKRQWKNIFALSNDLRYRFRCFTNFKYFTL